GLQQGQQGQPAQRPERLPAAAPPAAQQEQQPQGADAEQQGAGQQPVAGEFAAQGRRRARRDHPQVEPAEQQRQVQGTVGHQGHRHAPQPRSVQGAPVQRRVPGQAVQAGAQGQQRAVQPGPEQQHQQHGAAHRQRQGVQLGQQAQAQPGQQQGGDQRQPAVARQVGDVAHPAGQGIDTPGF